MADCLTAELHHESYTSDPVREPTPAKPERSSKINREIPLLRRVRAIDNQRIGCNKAPTPRPIAARSFDMSDNNSLTLPPLQRSVTDIGGLRTMYRRPKSPTPNYTMINKRVSQSASPYTFKALNVKSQPIPSLLDRPTDKEDFPKKNMQLWKDEVKKSVPSRPPIAIGNDWKAPPADWDDRDQYIYGAKPVFYKNTKYVLHKDFAINPEWLSEFMTVSTYSQAYRTCALRYGWSQ